MRGIKLSFLLLFLAFGAVQLNARDYFRLNAEGGINIRDIESVCTDSNGFIWASTRLGVIRIATGDSKSYSLQREGAFIKNIRLAYSGEKLFAYSDNGTVYEYDEAKDEFILRLKISELVNHTLSVHQLLCDADGSLWAASSIGLLKWSEPHGMSSVAFAEYAGTGSSMCIDGDDHILVCSERGIVRVNRKESTLSPIMGPDPRLKSLSSLYDPILNRLWIGTCRDGLLYLDLETGKLHEAKGISKSYPVTSLCLCDDNILLAGSDGGGLFFVQRESAEVMYNDRNDIDNPHSIGANNVQDISCYEGFVLVATRSEGLYYFRNREAPITFVAHRTNDSNSLANNHVNDVFESSELKTYVATDDGVDVYDISSRNWKHLCKHTICNAVFVDSKGRLWVGTYGNGFMFFDSGLPNPAGHYLASPSGSGVNCLNVNYFVEDNDGDVWILGDNLVLRFIRSSGRFEDLAMLNVESGCILPDGRLCLACDRGLIAYDKHSGESEVLCEGIVVDVCTDGKCIWAATSGVGLIRIDLSTKSCTYVTSEDGLNSGFVNSVLYDGEKIWLGTEIGLNCYDPVSGAIDNYQDFTILAKSNFNPSARFMQSNGALIFGTGDGLVKFHPDQLNRSQVKASIYIQDIRCSGKSLRRFSSIPEGTVINKVSEVNVKYSRNNFAIDLFPIGNFDNEFRFTWFMEGMDGHWSPPQTNNLCRYTNLKVGRNCLHIRLVDPLGKNVYDSREIVFNVQPPVWRQWWFILLAALLVTFVLESAWMYHIIKIKRRAVPLLSISKESDEDPFVKKAIEVVNRNYQNPDFDKDRFAAEMNVSASSLYKKLKTLTDQSPSEFIKMTRMTKALDFLQSHKYSVTEVSELCGYSSPSYFSTAFKGFYGKSPNEI